MEELASTLVEGYKKAKAAIEDLAENLVENEDLYDKACAALKRHDYENLDEVISAVLGKHNALKHNVLSMYSYKVLFLRSLVIHL